MYKRWTPAEDDIIRRNYLTVKVADLALLLPGRTKQAIYNRISGLSVAGKIYKYDWDKLEPVLLRLHTEHGLSVKRLEREFGLCRSAFRHRVDARGLSVDREFRIAELLEAAREELQR